MSVLAGAALEVKRILNCTEDEANALAPGGRLERGCVDHGAAQAVLDLVEGAHVAGEPLDATVNKFRKDGE